MKKTYKNNLISIVMRTAGDRPREIVRALQSIANNTYPNIEVVLVYQGTDSNQFRFLSDLAATFKRLNLVVIQNKSNEDRRAQNLNIGWEAATGKYIGFLDDDDTFEEGHLSYLYDALCLSEPVWGYTQSTLIKETSDLEILSKTTPFYRRSFSFSALWAENFIPIHSFLIDREKLCQHLQASPFCEDLNRSEDWDFLIRLAFFHKPKLLDIFTCNYHVSVEARNTNISLTNNSNGQLENKRAWDKSKNLIENRKSQLLENLWWAEELLLQRQLDKQSNYLSYIKKKISRLFLAIKTF